MEKALNCARITAYIHQTINSITKEYDGKGIKEIPYGAGGIPVKI